MRIMEERRLMTVREILKILHEDGWEPVEARTKGSHIQLKHSIKVGKVTVPYHKGDIGINTIKSIYKQAGLN